MPHYTARKIAELRRRAMEELGIDYDALPPLLRVNHITCSPKRAQPGVLPIAPRTWFDWVKAEIVEPPTKFENGISAWPKPYVVTLALDGLPREPGHGRKLPPGRAAPAPASTSPARLEAKSTP